MGDTHAENHLRTSDHCLARRTHHGNARQSSANCAGHLRWSDRECRSRTPCSAPNCAPCGSSTLTKYGATYLDAKQPPLVAFVGGGLFLIAGPCRRRRTRLALRAEGASGFNLHADDELGLEPQWHRGSSGRGNARPSHLTRDALQLHAGWTSRNLMS